MLRPTDISIFRIEKAYDNSCGIVTRHVDDTWKRLNEFGIYLACDGLFREARGIDNLVQIPRVRSHTYRFLVDELQLLF